MTDAEESSHRDLLKQFLANHDAGCPVCGYNLRGLQTGACPECSKRIELCVRAPDSHLNMYVATLVASAVTFGFTGLVGGVCAYFSIREGLPPGGEAIFVWTIWGFAIVSGVTLILLAGGRSRFLRQPPDKQKMRAFLTIVGALIMTVGYLLAFLWNIR